MNKLIALLFISLVCASAAYAQDAQMQKMMTLVRSLRSGGEKAFKAGAEAMAADKAWTPMNELRAADASAECRASDRVAGFKLNKMLASAEQSRRFETSTGNMLNGENPQFKYSLYERAVKAGCTVSYTLRARFGEQCFVVMPYDGLKAAGLEVTVMAGKTQLPVAEAKDAYVFSGRVPQGETVTVTIANKSAKPRSFAILNHNSRK